MNELVSVIIPMYNAENTIVKCLDTVKNQNFDGDFEIFVINDGSTDKSQQMVEKYIAENPEMNIQLFHQKNKGVSSARNLGLRQAKGQYIAFLDADDEWLKDKTKNQIEVFHQYQEIKWLATCGVGKKILFPYQKNENGLYEVSFRKLLLRNEILVPSVILKREIIDKVGLFSENQRYAEDVNYWLRISRYYKMYISAHELVLAGGGKRTFGVSGLSANLKAMHQGFLSNLSYCSEQKWISKVEYWLYFVFYKLKYAVLQFRKLM